MRWSILSCLYINMELHSITGQLSLVQTMSGGCRICPPAPLKLLLKLLFLKLDVVSFGQIGDVIGHMVICVVLKHCYSCWSNKMYLVTVYLWLGLLLLFFFFELPLTAARCFQIFSLWVTMSTSRNPDLVPPPRRRTPVIQTLIQCRCLLCTIPILTSCSLESSPLHFYLCGFYYKSLSPFL